MVDLWYSSISDFDDILRFRDFLRESWSERKALEDKSFPGSVYVYGTAYPILKEKAILHNRRKGMSFFGMIGAMFNPVGVATGLISQMSELAWEGWRERKSEVLEAASTITAWYANVDNDDGDSMRLGYSYTNWNHYEDHPRLYSI